MKLAIALGQTSAVIPAAALFGPAVEADEGMGTFDNPPVKQLQEKYNFTPTLQGLDHLRLSCVRLNDGGSGTFVSPRGLAAADESPRGAWPAAKEPKRYVDGKDKLDLSTPFNFVTTNHIIGGNSGSPVVNRNGDVVGLIFDGNIQSLVGDFVYDSYQNRAVAVHTAAMTEALKKLYDAQKPVDERMGH